MVRNKRSFGLPAVDAWGELPAHLRGGKTVPHVLQGATLDDFVWLGDDGGLDADALLDDLTSPHVLLRSVLLAVIEKHPVSEHSTDDRVAQAIRHLVGVPPTAGRRRTSDYDHHLAWMAREFLLGFYGFQEVQSSLDALAQRALEQDANYAALDPDVQHSRRKTLRKKFEREKDRLLVQLTADEATVRAAYTKVANAVEALRALGL